MMYIVATCLLIRVPSWRGHCVTPIDPTTKRPIQLQCLSYLLHSHRCTLVAQLVKIESCCVYRYNASCMERYPFTVFGKEACRVGREASCTLGIVFQPRRCRVGPYKYARLHYKLWCVQQRSTVRTVQAPASCVARVSCA